MRHETGVTRPEHKTRDARNKTRDMMTQEMGDARHDTQEMRRVMRDTTHQISDMRHEERDTENKRQRYKIRHTRHDTRNTRNDKSTRSPTEIPCSQLSVISYTWTCMYTVSRGPATELGGYPGERAPTNCW